MGTGDNVMATMLDVAKKAGVSIQTISAVINDKPGISEGTQERVRQAIVELDYHPNAVMATTLIRTSNHGRGD
jgi:DNA-binding LacI/PurR family transcriptional regulator